jgi:hypothetical protein
MNSSIRQTIKSFSDERWNIGFIRNDLDSIMSGDEIAVDWVKHNCKNSWFADPFILDVTDDRITVLVEEYYKPIHRGRIARLTIDRHSKELLKKELVLQLDTHLSFPAIQRREDGIYIYPENGAAGGLWLYKYDVHGNKAERVTQLVDEPVEDAIITSSFGGKKLFATRQPNPNGNELFIYDWNERTGKFTLSCSHRFDENIARMAGDFFEYKGKIYRPTQECNTQYGHAVTIQEVSLKNGEWNFHEIRRMYSAHPELTVGMHTFNMYKGMIVTDALGFDNMWFRKILKALHLLP